MMFSGNDGQSEVDCDILKNAKNKYCGKFYYFKKCKIIYLLFCTVKKWLFPLKEYSHAAAGSGGNFTVQLVIKLGKSCPQIGQFPSTKMNEECEKGIIDWFINLVIFVPFNSSMALSPLR